jgi:hypothetical protein
MAPCMKKGGGTQRILAQTQLAAASAAGIVAASIVAAEANSPSSPHHDLSP